MKKIIALAIIASAFGVANAQDCCQKEAVKAKAQGACCQSTDAKKIAKAGKGCCNEPGKVAKFKVFAGGKYHLFGCADSAEKGRTELMAKHLDVGMVQAVAGKKARIS